MEVLADNTYVLLFNEIAEWKRRGCPAPPPHIVKQLIIHHFHMAYGYSTLVETGTYLGDMVEAQKNKLKKIISVELGAELHSKACEKFKNDTHVRILQGDSGRILPGVVRDLSEYAVFWLDGHYSAGITAMGEKECPVFEEISAILEDYSYEPVILIDDARLFTGEGAYPSVEEVAGFILSRNSRYAIEVHHDIICCAIPQPGIPKPPREITSELLLGFLSYKYNEEAQMNVVQDDFLREVMSLNNSDLTNFEALSSNVSIRSGLPGKTQHSTPVNIEKAPLETLRNQNLWKPGEALRLHLGCGEQYFEGYVNIDYPPANHNVMIVTADAFADLTKLDFPPGTVDEIRLHHVFEHFNRVRALGMLIRWHRQLKTGGILHIETPDLMGSAQTLTSHPDWRVKMGNVRHLAGDQAASWAYHYDHWFPERFVRTLSALGFGDISAGTMQWPHPPHLSNVAAIAVKQRDLSDTELFHAAKDLLWESTVSDSEKPTHAVWVHQLEEFLKGGPSPDRVENLPQAADFKNAAAALQSNASQLPIEEIYDFNQRNRDRWVQQKAASIPAGASVLDVGAGTCPYSSLFRHCGYKTHDFKQYEGVKLGNTNEYGHIDFVSDIKNIPVPDNSFDVILCTEVLEHVPEPIAALKEMARIVKPGGSILITAPLGSGLHQLPFHFYGGYTPYWYRHFAEQFGLDVQEITSNGGFFRLLAQESARVAWTFGEHAHLHADPAAVRHLFGEVIPRYLFALEEKHLNEQFTIGYHVELQKPLKTGEESPTAMPEYQQPPTPSSEPRNVRELLQMAARFLEDADLQAAQRMLIAALAIEPDNALIKEFLAKLQSIQP